jgi:hypothetical protein
MHTDHAEPVVGAEEGYKLLGDGSGQVGTRVRGNLIVGEEGLRHTDSSVVLRRVLQGTKIRKMIYNNVHADMPDFVGREAMEGIHAYSGAGIGWLEVLRDWLDRILLEHTSSVLLAYWASCYDVDDLYVVYAVAGVHLVQVGSCLSDGAVLAVVNVASL